MQTQGTASLNCKYLVSTSSMKLDITKVVCIYIVNCSSLREDQIIYYPQPALERLVDRSFPH